LNKKNAPS